MLQYLEFDSYWIRFLVVLVSGLDYSLVEALIQVKPLATSYLIYQMMVTFPVHLFMDSFMALGLVDALKVSLMLNSSIVLELVAAFMACL